jgi:hypothetical protein
MSPHCRFSDLGLFRLRIFFAQVGNQTRTYGDESNLLEISMSSEMKGKPGLAIMAYYIGGATPFHSCMIVRSPKLVSSEDRTGARAPSASYCSTEGVAPFTHCASAGYCATSAGTLRHQCRYLRHQCRYTATSATT